MLESAIHPTFYFPSAWRQRYLLSVAGYSCAGGDDRVKLRCIPRNVPIDELSGLNRDAFAYTSLAKASTLN